MLEQNVKVVAKLLTFPAVIFTR